MTNGNQGWLCPKCNSAHAPDVKTCPVEPTCKSCGGKGVITKHDEGGVWMLSCMDCFSNRHRLFRTFDTWFAPAGGQWAPGGNSDA